MRPILYFFTLEPCIAMKHMHLANSVRVTLQYQILIEKLVNIIAWYKTMLNKMLIFLYYSLTANFKICSTSIELNLQCFKKTLQSNFL